jgi:hypothetical protein
MDRHNLEFKRASRAQREEIVKHRDRMVRSSGRLVSLDDAARDWISSRAAEWRAEFEVHSPKPACFTHPS